MFRSPEAKTPTKTNQKSARERLLSRTSRVVTVGSLALASMVGLGSHISAEASTPAAHSETTPTWAKINEVELTRNEAAARFIYGLYEKFKKHPESNVTESITKQGGVYNVGVIDRAPNGSYYDLSFGIIGNNLKSLSAAPASLSPDNIPGVNETAYFKAPSVNTGPAALYYTYPQADQSVLSIVASYATGSVGGARYTTGYFNGNLQDGLTVGVESYKNGSLISADSSASGVTPANSTRYFSAFFGALDKISGDVAHNPPLNVSEARVEPPMGMNVPR